MTKLNLNPNIPDHSVELNKVDDYINVLKDRIKSFKLSRRMSDKDYLLLYNRISDTLYYVGDLSKPLFDLSDDIEEKYLVVYKSTPELAKTLWLEHYSSLHKQYNLYKNRLYKLFEELGHTFRGINHCNTPKIGEE